MQIPSWNLHNSENTKPAATSPKAAPTTRLEAAAPVAWANVGEMPLLDEPVVVNEVIMLDAVPTSALLVGMELEVVL
jgi:hypothetical protein